jgi:methionyl-tRNA formyltransferase
MKILKIGYFADGPWAHKAFEKIMIDESLQISFVVPRSDSNDITLKNYSIEHDIAYLNSVNINSLEFIKQAKSYNCDLFISMSFNQIFKKNICNIPRLGIINCHAGKLPYYRGRNILNWALINDEKDFGITVHYIDEGIDTGDIILQKLYPISDEDNYLTLLEKSFEECARILYEAIKIIQADKVKAIKQSLIHPVGFYCGRRGIGDEIINWNQNSRDLFNFIRAICFPGPKATTFLNGNEVKINSSNLIENAIAYKGKPGQILAKTKKGFLIKTLDTSIEIIDIESSVLLKIGEVLK